MGKASEIATEMTSAGDLVNFFSPVPGGRSDCRALTITVTKPEDPLTARVFHSSSFFREGDATRQIRIRTFFSTEMTHRPLFSSPPDPLCSVAAGARSRLSYPPLGNVVVISSSPVRVCEYR